MVGKSIDAGDSGDVLAPGDGLGDVRFELLLETLILRLAILIETGKLIDSQAAVCRVRGARSGAARACGRGGAPAVCRIQAVERTALAAGAWRRTGSGAALSDEGACLSRLVARILHASRLNDVTSQIAASVNSTNDVLVSLLHAEMRIQVRKTRTPASLERLLLQRGTMVVRRWYAWLKLEGRERGSPKRSSPSYFEDKYNSTAIR